MRYKILAVILVACLVIPTASFVSAAFTPSQGAGVVNGNKAIYSLGVGASVGQEFVPEKSAVISVDIYLDVPAGESVVLELREKMRDTHYIAQKTVTFPTQTKNLVTFNFEKPVQVTPGEVYALVFSANSTQIFLYGTETVLTPCRTYNFSTGCYNQATLAFAVTTQSISAQQFEIDECEEAILSLDAIDFNSGATLTAVEKKANTLILKYSNAVTSSIDGYASLLSKRRYYNALSTCKFGDVDANGSVTAVDALLVLQASVEKIIFNEAQNAAADVEKNNKVEANDALSVLQYSVEVKTSFDVEAERTEHSDFQASGGENGGVVNELESLQTQDNLTVYNSTYKTMVDRTNGRGYALTSINGTYQGMFVRDSSIQALAHAAKGDFDYSRQLLHYILSYHKNGSYAYGVHIMGDVTENDTGNTYLSGASATSGIYSLQNDAPNALYGIAAPNNGGATEFSCAYSTINSVKTYITTNGGTATACIKTAVNGTVLAQKTINVGNGVSWAEFVFDSPVTVTPGTKYYLTLQTSASGVWYGKTSAVNSNYVGWNYDVPVHGGWQKDVTAPAFQIITNNATGSTGAITFGAGKTATQQMPAVGNATTAVDVILSKTGNVSGRINAVLKKGNTFISSTWINASALTDTAAWVKFQFALPLTSTSAADKYTITLSAPDCAENSIIWACAEGAGSNETYTTVNSVKTTVASEASFKSYSLTGAVTAISNKVQSESTFMLAYAWIYFYRNAERTAENQQFINDSYPILRDMLNWFTTNGYIKENGLMYNPSLEHSRYNRYWKTYDLITNTFASQGYHDMAFVAYDLGDTTNGIDWRRNGDSIARAVHLNLVATLDQKTFYAELFDAEQSTFTSTTNYFIDGFSWVNLATMAADWYAADENIEKNTYDLYYKYGSYDFYGYRILDAVGDFNLSTRNKYYHGVIGKGLAWELIYTEKHGNTPKLESLLDFTAKSSLASQPRLIAKGSKGAGCYLETFTAPIGSGGDAANQEQASWLLFAMSKIGLDK